MTSPAAAAVENADSQILLGTAPDSWGVWFDRDPHQVEWKTYLDEAAQAGYVWTELGPYGFLPPDAAQLKDELGQRGLRLSGGTVFAGLHNGEEAFQQALVDCREECRILTALDAKYLVLLPPQYTDMHTGAMTEPGHLEPEQWDALTGGMSTLGKALLEEFGVRQQFHSHADSHVGTTREVVRFLDETDPRYTNLCLDTGHFAYYGGDNVKLIEERPDRIGYLHLKQVDPSLLFDVLKNDVPFAEAVGQGIMIEPPHGVPDLAPIIEAVAAIDSEIFAIVEQDMYGCEIDRPFPIAKRTREHIFGCTHLARVH